MKRIEYDRGAYMRALQRGGSEESARTSAGWKETEEFRPIQNFIIKFNSWRYRTKQKKWDKIWNKQGGYDNQNKK